MTNDVFEDLVNLYLDKEINPAQMGILRTELERNSERRNTFESYCRMHQASHFAALTKCPVIPRLSLDTGSIKGKPGLFALNSHVWAAGLIIAVIGTFATVYLNGPFGSARIAQTNKSNLVPIKTFAQSTPESSEPHLEFFRTLKAENESQNWAYVQELRHTRLQEGVPSSRPPSFYTWSETQPSNPLETQENPGFDLEYSSYEFKR